MTIHNKAVVSDRLCFARAKKYLFITRAFMVQNLSCKNDNRLLSLSHMKFGDLARQPIICGN